MILFIFIAKTKLHLIQNTSKWSEWSSSYKNPSLISMKYSKCSFPCTTTSWDPFAFCQGSCLWHPMTAILRCSVIREGVWKVQPVLVDFLVDGGQRCCLLRFLKILRFAKKTFFVLPPYVSCSVFCSFFLFFCNVFLVRVMHIWINFFLLIFR